MQLTVNGKKEQLDKEMTILDFIFNKDENPESLVIEYNGEIVIRETWGKLLLKENDSLEILKFVGGG
ncbi:sulfur carrier protein ThiS [Natronospora cellulosivora (SeqCode)]